MGNIPHDPTPVADDIAERLLGIPFHPKLEERAIDAVISSLSRLV